ncbi:hypothetical protein QE152_g33645 [Popillia japonica]|uniref:Ribosomal protein L2 n=1 Tax=Popillia japonica TaxID=7064 RepID=A0AAW1IWH4_POPJA
MVAPGQSLIQDQAQVPAGGTPRQNQSINGNVGRCRSYTIRKAHGGALLPADLQSPTRHPLENRVNSSLQSLLTSSLQRDIHWRIESTARCRRRQRMTSLLQTAYTAVSSAYTARLHPGSTGRSAMKSKKSSGPSNRALRNPRSGRKRPRKHTGIPHPEGTIFKVGGNYPN